MEQLYQTAKKEVLNLRLALVETKAQGDRIHQESELVIENVTSWVKQRKLENIFCFPVLIFIKFNLHFFLLRKEGNVLFNDTLNRFYLRLYGVRHMVKDHSDSERGNPLPPHGLLFSISSKGYFICIIHTDRITHTTVFVTPVMEHWLEREIAQWVHFFLLIT